MSKDLTAVRIPGDLIDALKAISEQPSGFYSERTPSWLIVQAVKEFVERHAPAQAKGKKRKSAADAIASAKTQPDDESGAF